MKIVGQSQEGFLIGYESNKLYHKKTDDNWTLAVQNVPDNYDNISLVWYYMIYRNYFDVIHYNI